jgi:hypothetical protein
MPPEVRNNAVIQQYYLQMTSYKAVEKYNRLMSAENNGEISLAEKDF